MAACVPGLDHGLARAGLALFRDLPRAGGPPRLLGTDVHAGNVLAAGRAPWLVIDPKPYVGDPTYDALQHLVNCEARLRADPEGLVGRMATRCGLEAPRLRLWLFARCVVETPRRPVLAAVARRLAPRWASAEPTAPVPLTGRGGRVLGSAAVGCLVAAVHLVQGVGGPHDRGGDDEVEDETEGGQDHEEDGEERDQGHEDKRERVSQQVLHLRIVPRTPIANRSP